jgi:glucose-6-phosphate 1-dehydrogenase
MPETQTNSSCQIKRPGDPCAIVLFGASGDLTSKKLMPALYGLFVNNYLPNTFYIIGCARSELNDDSFRDRIRSSLENISLNNEGKIDEFLGRLYYHQTKYDDLASYSVLAGRIESLDKENSIPANRLFYLAVPPNLYNNISNMLGSSGLSVENDKKNNWTRIVVEKPFGRDLETAKVLDVSLKKSFKEDQIYRIDHYLAKETVQNILFFRFANTIFEPLWNSQYIEYVDILAAEKIGIEKRAGYYENAGIIRDMFQNHMMQLFSLIAMEPPSKFTSEVIRDEKAKLFNSLRSFDVKDKNNELVLAQYKEGEIDGEKVCSYRNEEGVDPSSLIPTYASFKMYVDNQRWKGVPFYMRAGKRLDQKMTRIIVQFKNLKHSIFNNVIRGDLNANRLTFYIQPVEKITLSFETKNPGSSFCAGTRNMEFIPDGNEQHLDAYEKVILDCLNGEQMLFLRQDAEELCWSYFTGFLKDCATCFDPKKNLKFYEAGTSFHNVN